MNKRQYTGLWIAVIVAVGLMLTSLQVSAGSQGEFPAKEVKIISPWDPGGLNDVLSRAIAQHSEKFLGKPIVVENMPGGGGVVGTKFVERAQADGYVLVMASSSTIFTQYSSTPPNDIKNLAPVNQICIAPQVLVINSEASWKDIQSFISDCKANPDKVSVANSGSGGSSDLYTSLLEKETGIKVKHIPYKGYAPAMTAVLGGHVDATIVPPGVAKQHVEAGKARVLAIATEERFRDLPDAPTFKEQGVDLVIEHWVGLMAPAGTPQETLNILVKAFQQGMKTAEFQTLMEKRGLEIKFRAGEEFQEFLDREDAKWGPIIKGQ
jgi:tripartite-type tricarboxylate transporter receptor subunit TctC